MAALSLILALVLAFPAFAATKTVHGKRCSFSFEYPDGWTVEENPAAKVLDPEHYDKRAECAVGLRPPGWKREMRTSALTLQPYPIRLVFWNRSFVTAAKRSFFGRYRDDPELRPHPGAEWFIFVRQGTYPAHDFVTACCQIVRGDSWAHATAKDGSTATVVWEGAVVNDRHRHSVVIQSDQFERFHPVVDQLVESLRFGEP